MYFVLFFICMWWWSFFFRFRMGCRLLFWRGSWCFVEIVGVIRLVECGFILMVLFFVNIMRFLMVFLNNIENDVNFFDMVVNYDRRFILRYLWLGRIFGRWIVWCVFYCGGNIIYLIFFIWGLLGGFILYK